MKMEVVKPLQILKKIGDSANNGLTLISYGCYDGNNALNKSIIDCDFDNLKAVGLTANNDGFLRGVNLQTGELVYEFMPKELLVNIDKLQIQKSLSREKVRTYRLDSRVMIYHNDTNNNGYIDNDERAYAIVTAGRGGAYIYGVDISNRAAPILLWTITNKTPGFERLANTWSKPAIGKVKVGQNIKAVAIIGGGYDETQDTNKSSSIHPVGNVIYMIDIASGNLLQAFTNKMNYSVAGNVAFLTEFDKDEQLISDVFFGDLGGQLWRLKVKMAYLQEVYYQRLMTMVALSLVSLVAPQKIQGVFIRNL